MSKEFEIDFSEFNKGLKKATDLMIDGAKEGMGVAGMQLLNDAVMEEPTVPHKEGFLRGSGSIFVDDKLIGVSNHGDNSLSTTDHNEKLDKDEIVAIVGFNAPYAMKLHEAEPGSVIFTEPSAGSKYLTKKLSNNRKIYFQIISNRIKYKL